MTTTKTTTPDNYDNYCEYIWRLIHLYASGRCRLFYRADFLTGMLSVVELPRSQDVHPTHEGHGFVRYYPAPDVITVADWRRLSNFSTPLLLRISAGLSKSGKGRSARYELDEVAGIALKWLESLLSDASASEFRTAGPSHIRETCYLPELADLSDTELRNLATSLGEEALDDKVVLAFDEITVLEFWRKELREERMMQVV
jgi:hypothetical protein